ncbi:hypothetical protein ASPWEDRAFT_101449 [Aspergillus wentii DTO 134E9]|uniref:Nuclear protein DGCR14 n=1 Tax=Aspergillus wentii DTO 134E9 TaxID=1073089 RepID=A0A1L9S2D0_ASPWE|nr:uncharacterized protein ASPWEDRAFT_101449 [Aspergillus wentii DTO 134E9]KAI9924371.1 hypothetical protein MW887_006997 [Aspergillus wentii]OJJ41323.1 hypothetical protein ASPWEDRAFT_101449 [Aspergillus wentii DTO 134E9]
MTSPLSQALTKRSNDQSLMPPPPPPKRIKRPATVLDEDIYTNALSEIIARDYFPGLLETQIKQEYLEAVESKDKEWIASSKQKLAGLMTPGNAARTKQKGNMTPRISGGRPDETPAGWGGDTPMSVVSTSSATTTATEARPPKEIPDVSRLGLQAFQAKYTSEDNESFNKLLDKQNVKHREKYAWLWNGNKVPSAQQIAHQRQEAKRIAARGEMPQQEQQEQQLVLKTDMDARPAKPDSWKVRPENSLMFLPSSIEDTHETIAQKAETASRAGPKRVLHQNTRLPDPDLQAAAAQAPPPSPSISAIQDAIAGRPRPTESDVGYTGGETPRVNGYAFVDEDEPEPEPESRASDIDFQILGSGDSTPNPFEIKGNRKREDLHHRMVDRFARTKRAEKSARETRSPVIPRFAGSPRINLNLRTPGSAIPGSGGQEKTLTPAGQKLLQRVGSTPRGSSSSSNLKNMWTPTPKRK